MYYTGGANTQWEEAILRGDRANRCKVYGRCMVSCAKTAEPIEMPFWVVDSGGPRKHVLVWDAHWRHLAKTTEPSMCCGDSAFLLNYFDHLLLCV